MNEQYYSKPIANSIKNFLNDEKIFYFFDEKTGSFRFGQNINKNINNKIKNLQYLIFVKTNSYLLYASSPIGADKNDQDMVDDMADFVCRANYDITKGNFDFNMDTGELRFKIYVDCEETSLTPIMLYDSIYSPSYIFEKYCNGIINIILGDIPAKEAYESCNIKSDSEIRAMLLEMAECEKNPDMAIALKNIANDFGQHDDETEDEDYENEDDDYDIEEETINIKTNLFNTEDTGV